MIEWFYDYGPEVDEEFNLKIPPAAIISNEAVHDRSISYACGNALLNTKTFFCRTLTLCYSTGSVHV